MNFSLDTFLPYRLSQLTNYISRDLARRYEGEYKISRTQWRIMAALISGQRTAQEIAAKTVMDKSVISRAVKDLIQRGLLKRGSLQSDGRAAPLSLTPPGKRMAAAISEIAMALETELKAKLTPAQQEQLDGIITALQTPAATER